MVRLYSSTSFRPIINERLEPVFDKKREVIVVGRTEREQKKEGDEGLLDLGVVCEKQANGKSYHGFKVMMDAKFPHIVFICGKRGGGKSYTLGVMAEELCKTEIGIGTVIVDPIGIYWSMKEENRNKKEVTELEKWGLSPSGLENIRILVPPGLSEENEKVDGTFSIKPAELTSEEWCLVFDLDRFKTQGLLIGEALGKVREGYRVRTGPDEVEYITGNGDNYNIGDIIDVIDRDIDLGSDEKGYARTTRRSVIARFKAAQRWGIFSEHGTPIEEISVWDTVTVIDVSHPKLENQVRALIVGILAKKILQARMLASRREQMGIAGDGESIPVTWLMIDEAHLLIPRRGLTAASKPLIDYAKLGRKPGCALVLATQRPAATDDDILSQIDMLVGHSLGLEDDIGALLRRVPSKLPSQMAQSDFIRGIPAGSALLADQKTQQRAMLVRVRPRLSHHSGKEATPVKREIQQQEAVEGQVTDDTQNTETGTQEGEEAGFEIMAASEEDQEVEVSEEEPAEVQVREEDVEVVEEVPGIVLGSEEINEDKDYANQVIMQEMGYFETDYEGIPEDEPAMETPEETEEERAKLETETEDIEVSSTPPIDSEEIRSFPIILRENSAKGLTIEDLKTTWTGKPKEFVESIELVYLPMIEAKISTERKKFIRGTALIRCELLMDINTCEMVTDFKEFKRSKGLSKLSKLEKRQMDVLSFVIRGYTPEDCESELDIRAKRVTEIMRELSSLDILDLERDKKGYLTGSLTKEISFPSRPESVDGELPSSAPIKAAVLLPQEMDRECVRNLANALYPEYTIEGMDLVHMPYYQITYSSEEGSRLSYINAYTGLFEDIEPRVK